MEVLYLDRLIAVNFLIDYCLLLAAGRVCGAYLHRGRFALAALVCGLCWETWNYYALAKWIYSVPFVHRFQIWEMPLIGFGGYLPFGMECAAVTAWICPSLIENGESGKD